MDFEAISKGITEERDRLRAEVEELSGKLEAAREKLDKLEAAAQGLENGSQATAPRQRKEAPQSGKQTRPKNKGASLGQTNRWYWWNKEKGNKEKTEELLVELKAAGKKPWPLKK